MNAWQDISTAPKNGDTILVWDEGTIYGAVWGDGDEDGDYDEGFIYYYLDSYEWADESEINPSHWMPLPEGPK